MSFNEKLMIVLFSGCAGVFFSLATNYFVYKIQFSRRFKEIPNRLELFSRDLQASIVNNDAEALKPHRDYLLSNYSVLSSCSDLKRCFDEMNSIYYFLSDGGYHDCPERKTADLERIYSCQKRLKR